MNRCKILALVIGVFVWLSAVAAAADDGYQDVAATPQAAVSAPLHVVIAYGLIWVVLLGYLVFLMRRQSRLAAEIEDLRKKLGKAGGS